jgi:hypothetical protein
MAAPLALRRETMPPILIYILAVIRNHESLFSILGTHRDLIKMINKNSLIRSKENKIAHVPESKIP